MRQAPAQPTTFGPRGPLAGPAQVPGDKSISHRALILAALAAGRSRIANLSTGDDVAATAAALRAMGARIERTGEAQWQVDGLGTGCLLEPEGALDMGNSGTAARLVMGVAASHPLVLHLVGDRSLCRRPMARLAEPLGQMGAGIVMAPGGRLPLAIRGACPAVPGSFALDIPSAQVKSALMLAALNTPGVTRIAEPAPSRDHGERLFERFGVPVEIGHGTDGARTVAVTGEAELVPAEITIPGDISAAAFLVVAALVVPGSEIVIEKVGVNPGRRALLDLLGGMGGDIRVSRERLLGNEPVADIEVRHSPLRAADVPRTRVPAMIDEFPVFFIAAAFAEGESRAEGLGELRHKESDRLATMARGLAAIGVEVGELEDGLVVAGSGGAPVRGGATVSSALDHRIAMAFAVAGLHAEEPITVDNMRVADTSFPGFAAGLAALGAP
ncbi:MAG: 3-phosphoshikimate 1-carboxyvinyltransferase [Sphingomonadaceae bacterium]